MDGPLITDRRATDGRLRLRREVFDALAAKRGAETVVAQAELTGVPRRTLYNLFAGTEPSLATASKLALALGCRVGDLFEQEGHAA